jgi:Cu2+-exporting ATPase
MLARQRWQMTGQVFAELTPSRARLIDNNGQEHWCNLRDLCPGQRIAVEAGDIFPVDGHVLLGHSSSDQSIITGEFDPVLVGPGSTVLAGARNVEARLEVEVHEQRPEHTGLGQITQLIREARQSKPPIARMADRQASWLVGGVLVLAGLSYLFWHVHDPDRALWVTLAVLVATCPCALSLATPVALSSAAAAMVHQGFHLIRPDALQTLPDIDQVLLDKTGTLTRGRPEITHIEVLGPLNRNRMLEIGARLEAASRHPFRLAFPAAVPADGAEVEVGAGICGLVDGQTFWLGSPSWVATRSGTPQINCTASNTSGTCIALARRDCCLGWFRIEDQLRDSAYELIARLRAEGLDPCLLTGDPGPDGQQLADRLGIRLLASGASPQDKLAFLDQLRNQGHRVMMVGDGINDIPVLSAANFSVAMGHATDLARIHADAVLVNGQLSVIARAILLSRRTRKVIAQNITWALCYNLVAVPLAVSGFLTPWMAAIGMTSSSLIVVGNAFRLFRKV